MAQIHFTRMRLQANTLIRGAQYISEDDVARLIGDIINEANAVVHLTPPDDMPIEKLNSFAKGLAVEEILDAIKQYKEGDADKALDIFYAKCSAGLATNEVAHSAVTEALADLSGKENMFQAMRYAEDVDILTRMLKNQP